MKKLFFKFLLVVATLAPSVVLAASNYVPTDSFGLPKLSGGGDAYNLAAMIIRILLAIAALVTVLFIIIGGFRYITSAGNEELAEAGKKTLQNAIIGLVVIILSYIIVQVIFNTLT